MTSSHATQRHARHIVLKEIGGAGQQRLYAARVLIVGVGGLGCPTALYLAAAGVRHITLVDPDTVSLSNLQRQVLFDTKDVGRLKVEAGRDRLRALDPETGVYAIPERLTARNAADLISNHDLVIDGSDSFETRFIVNSACIAQNVALVCGAVGRWDAQVFLSLAGPTRHRPPEERGPCYQCLVPGAPDTAEPCAEAGIVGALTGVAGSLMATEAIRYLARPHKKAGSKARLLIYNGLDPSMRSVWLSRDPQCPACGPS